MAGDTGDGLSPLDHAFNAMLLLAHVALIRGDQVGLLAFSDRVRAFVAPCGGPRRIKRLVHSVHNVFPEMVESRYDRAFIELENRCRKRSLVVLMTNLFDDLNAQLAGEYLRQPARAATCRWPFSCATTISSPWPIGRRPEGLGLYPRRRPRRRCSTGVSACSPACGSAES